MTPEELVARLREELADHVEDASEHVDQATATTAIGDVKAIIKETESVARYHALPAFVSDALLTLLLSSALYAALFIFLSRYVQSVQAIPVIVGSTALFTYFCVRPLVTFLGRGVAGYAYAVAAMALPMGFLTCVGINVDTKILFADADHFLAQIFTLLFFGGVGSVLGLWYRNARFTASLQKVTNGIALALSVLLPIYVFISALVLRAAFHAFDPLREVHWFLLPRMVFDVTVTSIIRMLGHSQTHGVFIAVIWLMGIGIAVVGVLSAVRVIRFFRSKDRTLGNFPGFSLALSLYAFSLLVVAPTHLAMLKWQVPHHAVTADAEASELGPFLSLFRLTYVDDRRYGYSVEVIDGDLQIQRSNNEGVLISAIINPDMYATSRLQDCGDNCYQKRSAKPLPEYAVCDLDTSRVMGFPGRPDEHHYCHQLTIHGVSVFTANESVIVDDVLYVKDGLYALRIHANSGSAEWVYLVDIGG